MDLREPVTLMAVAPEGRGLALMAGLFAPCLSMRKAADSTGAVMACAGGTQGIATPEDMHRQKDGKKYQKKFFHPVREIALASGRPGEHEGLKPRGRQREIQSEGERPVI